MKPAALALTICLLPLACEAEEGERFYVEGDRLYYNSEIAFPGSEDVGVVWGDWNEFYYYLSRQNQIKTVVLASQGGSVGEADKIAKVLTDFKVDTLVEELCISSCVHMFIAGEERLLGSGALLGFHRAQFSSAYVAKHASAQGVPVDAKFVVQMYDEGIESALAEFNFFTGRGVTAEFVLEVLSVSPSDVWFPTRAELFKAGVTTAP